jgi:hypothetical protein
MTRKAINLLNMLKSVVRFYEENPAILADKPALKTAVDKLKAFIAEIEDLEKVQAKDTKADTTLKGETKTALINAALKVLAGMAAHAAATNDTRLKMDSDISERELEKMRDNNLITEIYSIHETATEIATELKGWNVEQADIDALDTNTAAFDAKDPAIKNIKARSVQATADLKAKLDEAYNFTKDTLDPMMMPTKIANPTVYGHYQNARTIINTAGGHSKPTAPDVTAQVK